jgi:ABC-type transport system involved in cytochrome c biogenesis ATPase subunit
MHPIPPLPPLLPGLIAITGGERTGKTSLLRRLGGDPAVLPAEPPAADTLWLDLALPAHDQDTPEQVWAHLQARCPRWNNGLQQDLAQDLALDGHLGKKLFMLSAGSRRKVALVGLLASGTTVTCLDQPYSALDMPSVRVLREFLADMATHATRTWVVADYEADMHLPWKHIISLD